MFIFKAVTNQLTYDEDPVFTCSCHVIDVLVCQDWFIKIATPVRTGHVWTGKISFVRVPNTVAALKGIPFSISVDHCDPNTYA